MLRSIFSLVLLSATLFSSDIPEIYKKSKSIMLLFFKTSKTTFFIHPLTIPIVTVFLLQSLNY